MKRLLTVFAAVLIAGCATGSSPQVNAKRQQFEATIPTCSGEADCSAKWDAAQLWVVKNSGYKIQTATNVLIETYGSVGSSTDLAVRVTKEPLGGGAYKFVVYVYCGNIFGCFPDPWDTALAFNREIGATAP